MLEDIDPLDPFKLKQPEPERSWDEVFVRSNQGGWRRPGPAATELLEPDAEPAFPADS